MFALGTGLSLFGAFGMRTISRTAHYAAGVCAAAFLIAGCGGPPAANALPPSTGQTAATKNVPPADEEKSWMDPRAKRLDLIYVANSNGNSVSVYAWNSRKLVGVLEDIYEPMGLCSDTSGNVWIVSSYHGRVLKYAHAATKPSQVLKVDDDDTDLYDCAVDPTTGNLAVTDWGYDWFKGYVLVYQRASGEPVEYTGSNLWYYYSCAYDDKGNLYADGWDAYVSDIFSIGELHKGGARFENLSLHPTIKPLLLGGMRWDGARLAVGDMGSLYEYTVKGRSATMSGYTPLTSEWLSGAFAIRTFASGAQTVVAADSAGNPSAVQYWPYPKGGTPSATITNALDAPHGTAVSIAQ
jgi:hypothetical protein